jgi:hypothetical protein
MDVFVARQPILDRDLNVYGYELLYRSGDLNAYTGSDATIASLQVLNNCFFNFDPGEVVGGNLAFVNFTRDLLLQRTAETLPPQSVVVEVLEDVPGDTEVLGACRRLRELGYRIAADDISRRIKTSRYWNWWTSSRLTSAARRRRSSTRSSANIDLVAFNYWRRNWRHGRNSKPLGRWGTASFKGISRTASGAAREGNSRL